ncbi:hypothetical protein Neosp_010475 [[Neocosmospora] mangrovei]
MTTDSDPDPGQITEDVSRDQNIVNHRGWRRVVLGFTPSWFTVTMGTGITSILLHNLPYNGRWLYWISVVIFSLNILLFVSFLCTFPMGLSTIINMITFVCVPAWGARVAIFAWALWWINITLAMACNFYIPYAIMQTPGVTLSSLNASWLLPIVADIVASATGAIVANVLPNEQHALWTVIISYILWGMGPAHVPRRSLK